MPDTPPATRVEVADGVGHLVFDNPRRHNALTAEMLDQACAGVARLAADDAVRAVLLRGAGETAFVAGADITGFADTGRRHAHAGWTTVLAALEELDKPVVAMLRGWCLGGGVLVALAADIRLAGDDLKMGVPAARLGVAYPNEAVRDLVDVVGPAVAAELLFTGEPLDAARAREVGLVNRVVPAAELSAETDRLLARLAGNAPLTLRAAKRSIRSARSPADPARAEAAGAAIADCLVSADFREGQAAFAEKRPPRFTGR